MKNKLTVLTLLTLISTLMIAVPIKLTSASPDSAELHVIPFTLNQAGSATAEWTTADKHTGSYSVNLTTTTTNDYAAVAFEPADGLGGCNGSIDSITSLSFWYKHISYADWCGPRMALVMMKDGQNYLAVTGCAVNSTTEWKKADGTTGGNLTTYGSANADEVWWYGTWNGSDMTTYNQTAGSGDTPINFTTLKSSLTGANVLNVAIYMGVVDTNVGLGSTYIDDPEINSVTYHGRIQDAIDTAPAGDTIIVATGTYNERIVVNRALTIQGISKETTIIHGSGYNPTITITANDVTISEFTVEQEKGLFGISTSTSITQNNIVLFDNIFDSRVQLYSVDNAEVFNNEFKIGLLSLWSSVGGEIYNNNISTFGVGIALYGCNETIIENNEIFAADKTTYSDSGIHAQSCERLAIRSNTILNFTAGPKSGYNHGTKGAAIYLLASSECTLEHNLLVDNTIAIFVDMAPASPINKANYNNIEGNKDFGIFNAKHPTSGTWYYWEYEKYSPPDNIVDGTFNWWGHENGPSTGYVTTGDRVSANVTYVPWLDASHPGGTPVPYKTETIANDILDAKTEADTEVVVTGTATVTVAKYPSNPGTIFEGDIRKYIDVHINTTESVDWIEVRLYYNDTEIAGLDESSLKMHWWDGAAWVLCSDTGVNTTGTNGYRGYIWAHINASTTPSLSNLVGTPFGATGTPTPPPPVEAGVSIHPETLNLKSKGKWITAFIKLPEGYDVTDIDVESVKLWYGENSTSAKWGNVEDGVLMVKFNRTSVIELLNGTTGEVELTITAEVNGSEFKGIDTIRVISPGRK